MPSNIVSNMAGTLLEVTVKVGDNVKVGQEVLILESMKMEVPISSVVAGKVTAILKNKGDFVNEGETVIEIA
ncbi:MAG: acetyl-CoA carboxylase biotin carboxyl carrier protein subunit [Proteobacteria bacterium]|jgi:acetyl-CoA carboxylase biotin carboxyl carrier protein|nr:acetyl-CoA carboxylase biotin carboxyl carrier protein subunit [Pseudomonadota bacterium]